MIEKIKKFAKENHVPIMLDDGLSFLLSYIKDNNIKTVLEVGSAIGFSAIMMANLGNDIFVDTVEIDVERYNMAVNNIREFNLEAQINVFHADALTFKTEKKYDLIFIDAAKAQYKRYMEYYLPNLQGVFVFDNINFHGMVDNPDLTKNRNTKNLVRKIKIFRDEILADNRFTVTYHKDVGDGVIVAKLK